MRLSAAIIVGALALVLALPVAGQETSSLLIQAQHPKPLGVVQRGNTTIVFEPADSHDIDMASLRSWGEFADEHPKIAHELAYRPSLINNVGYLRRNSDLASFFQTHPDIKKAMVNNPGNFVAIPPRPGE
jgi:hypothetical protein